ncbi:MAG: sigma-70 family RNA polymerase sigma factor [Bryobacteraceae bacterium]
MQLPKFDRDYIDRLNASDPETETAFTSYVHDLLQPKVRLQLRSWQGHDDVIQETFLRVLQTVRSNGIHRPERLTAFICSVCDNVLFEYFRTNKRWLQLPVEGFDLPDETLPPESKMLLRERGQELRRVLADLPKRDRELLRSLFLEEEDRDQICRRYGVEREYLRVLVHRAKLKLRSRALPVVLLPMCA